MSMTTEDQIDEVVEAEARYITKIRLENFQDHTDTVIELEPGINLITGSSDAGKSAALRALNFVLHNQPRGDAFIQLGANEYDQNPEDLFLPPLQQKQELLKKAVGVENVYDDGRPGDEPCSEEIDDQESDKRQDIVDRIKRLSGIPTAAIQELSNDEVFDD